MPQQTGGPQLPQSSQSAPGITTRTASIPSCRPRQQGASHPSGGPSEPVLKSSSDYADPTLERLSEARRSFWEAVELAESSGDTSAKSRDPEWRQTYTNACKLGYNSVGKSRKLKNSTLLWRSQFPDRAQSNVNPAHVAVATQPAVKQGLMTQQEADDLINIAHLGVSVAEFRDFRLASLDLRTGAEPDSADSEVLLNFYYEQAAKGRVAMFPADMQQELDENPELVISPSFVVRAPGKKPRAILHLSSTERGANQRMLDDLVANADGYSTLVDVSRMILKAILKMVLYPELFDISDTEELELLMIVMDGDSAFFRIPVSAECVGIQATRVSGITIVPLCCTFGWKRSAETFSHVTAAIQRMHASDLDSASFITEQFGYHPQPQPTQALSRLMADKNPVHSHESSGHVDDFAAIELALGRRPQASASDLAWAIKVMLGADGISAKKFKASTFWTDFQKLIGGWFDVSNFTVAMPHDKIIAVLDMLNSESFSSDKTAFSINECASLRGKSRWASYATPLGDWPALINIERQRRAGESGKRLVKPWRHHNESEQMALEKFHNDLMIRKVFFTAAAANPSLATASLLSVLPPAERLTIPGEADKAAVVSGDFSINGQSFGVEVDDKRLWSFIKHPPVIIDMLRQTLAGNAESNSNIIMSSVLERQNKLFAECMFSKELAGRVTICYDDNQGSVACINSGYARNPAMQSMQLLSGLRQALDEAPMMGQWVCTENMSIWDETSRLETAQLREEYVDKFNTEADFPWTYVAPTAIVQSISNWLSDAINAEIPMLEGLLRGFTESHEPSIMPCSLNIKSLSAQPSTKWQDRSRAATRPIPHTIPGGWMGSFGPAACYVGHLDSAPPSAGSSMTPLATLINLQRQSNKMARTSYTMFDAFSGGCSATIAAISAGLHVVSGAETQEFEISIFEHITGRLSLGDVRTIAAERVPWVDIWTTCSLCQDFSSLGRNKMPPGIFGHRGALFTEQFLLAAASGARCIVWENVTGVLTLQGGIAVNELKRNAELLGYGNNFFVDTVSFADHGEPENRVRVIGIAFHDSVLMKGPFLYPEGNIAPVCAGEFLDHSSLIPGDHWEHRHWYPDRRRSGTGKQLITMGFCDPSDTIGTPERRSRVWNMMGLCPTMLASGNSQYVLAFRMRHLCFVYLALTQWRLHIHQRPWQQQKGCPLPRKITVSEALAMRQYPEGYPRAPARDVLRCIGGGIPIRYLKRLYSAVSQTLVSASEEGLTEDNPSSYSTERANETFQILVRVADTAITIWLAHTASISELQSALALRLQLDQSNFSLAFRGKPLHPWLSLHNYGIRQNDTVHMSLKLLGGSADDQRIKRGNSIFLNLSRDQLSSVPVEDREWQAMATKRKEISLGNYAESSIDQIRNSIRHWYSFCDRFNLPRYLLANSPSALRQATAQAELFIIYELANFDIKADTVIRKLWAVSIDHKDKRLPDPFENNTILDQVKKDALKKDRPQMPKIPVTERIIWTIRDTLDMRDKKAYITYTGLKFALSFCCRVSEWAFGEIHCLNWEHLIFYDANGKELILTDISQLPTVAELEAVFMTDKSHREGHGTVRSIFSMTDIADPECVVRAVARMWLLSDRDKHVPVFSWDSGKAGVLRASIARILKHAAIKVGLPESEISTHSLRIGGLCLLMAHGMPYEDAKSFGRWRSDCARRYFWPSTSLARGFADVIWKPTRFTRVRGGGAVQRI